MNWYESYRKPASIVSLSVGFQLSLIEIAPKCGVASLKLVPRRC